MCCCAFRAFSKAGSGENVNFVLTSASEGGGSGVLGRCCLKTEALCVFPRFLQCGLWIAGVFVVVLVAQVSVLVWC